MKRILFAVTILGIALAGCGGGGGHTAGHMDGSTGTSAALPEPSQTVDVTMVDIGYRPTTLNVHRGDRVEFVFHNEGKIPHDAFIGNTAAQAEHEQQMGQGGNGSMGGGHMSEANAITVEPGSTGHLTYMFDQPGTTEIACHQPGHYTAGMKIAVTVA